MTTKEKTLYQLLEELSPLHYAFDSRQVKKGSVFFALKGSKVDGHLFIENAIEKGAVAAVISSPHIKATIPLFVLQDVVDAMQMLAKEKINLIKPHIIGITGSVGKTSTKEFLATLLLPYIDLSWSQGSQNSQVSLPTTILNFDSLKRHYLLEMGMSKKNEMDRLVDIAPPHIAVVTNVSASHIEYFSSLEEIAHEKRKIFCRPDAFKLLSYRAKQYIPDSGALTYGNIESAADFRWKILAGKLSIQSPFWGFDSFYLPQIPPHLIENLVAAIIIAKHLHLTFDQINTALEKIRSVPHRFEITIKNGVCLIDDSYNASEESTIGALTSLPQNIKGKKILIFGELKEQGAYSPIAHRKIGEVAANAVDYAFCLGDATKPILEIMIGNGKKGEYFEDKMALLEAMRLKIKEGDIVLIKGAKSHELWELIERF